MSNENPTMSAARAPLGVEMKMNLGQIIVTAVVIISASTIYMGKVDTNQSATQAAQTDIKQLRVDVTAQLSANRTDATAQYTAFKAEMIAQMTQQQVNIDRQFRETRDTINNIPSVTERVSQLERTAERLQKQQDQDHSASIENTTNMNNLLRQLGAAQKVTR